MSVKSIILNAVGKIFEIYFTSDLEVMSPKAKQILSNPEDRKIYMDAIKRIKEEREKSAGKNEKDIELRENITLSNDEKITVVI